MNTNNETISSKVKICFMCSNISYAGAQRQLFELAKNMNKSKYEVRICSLSSYNSREVPKQIFSSFNMIDTIDRYFKYDLSWFVRIYKYLKKNRFKILYTFLPLANRIGLLLGKLSGIKIIILSERNSDYYLSKTNRYLLNISIKYSNCVIANSNRGRIFLMNSIKRAYAYKIQVVYNGSQKIYFEYDSSKLDKKDIGISNDSISICLVARFKPQKNHTMFFQVAKNLLIKYDNLVFICIGDSDKAHAKYHRDIMQYFKKLNISKNFIFLGYREDIYKVLPLMDICVLTSNYEGLSNSLIEYMQSGCPVVVTDISDHKDLIEEGVNGYVVPPTDVNAMKNKIEILINDKYLRREISSNNKLKAEHLFSVDRMVTQTENIFDQHLFNG